MNLYLLTAKGDVDYDAYNGFVVAASTSLDARKIGEEKAAKYQRSQAFKVVLIGWSTHYAKPRIVLADCHSSG